MTLTKSGSKGQSPYDQLLLEFDLEPVRGQNDYWARAEVKDIVVALKSLKSKELTSLSLRSRKKIKDDTILNPIRTAAKKLKCELSLAL